LVNRKDRQRNVDQMSATLRTRLLDVPGITVTHVGLLDSVGGNKQVEFSLQGRDLQELERLTVDIMAKVRTIPGLVDLDSSIKPNKPTVDVQLQREAANEYGLSIGAVGQPVAHLGRWHHRDQLAR
jgi:HAE1 family hydrophobic/amphiphilic exporter-1